MKTLVFGIIFLGLTSLSIAQENSNGINTVALEDVTVSVINKDYLYEVIDSNTPEVVQNLHNKAASFDVKSAPGFDSKSRESYEAVFKATNGSLVAAYGPSGQIISSFVRFTDVTLPLTVREKVFKNKKGWQMVSNQYSSIYANKKQLKERYKIKLFKGADSKRLVLDMD